MFERRVLSAVFAAALCSIALTAALPACAQDMLYNNGPDGDVGYYHVNFGAVVVNSFVLTRDATVTSVNFTVYDVDDANTPLRVLWRITTQPFGGQVMGEGFVPLTLLQDPYPTKFQFFAWPVGFNTPNISLSAGTYYLQLQDVVTFFDTWAFWAQSSGGSSQAYYEPIAGNGAGGISQVPSEAFAILGQWSSAQPSEARPERE